MNHNQPRHRRIGFAALLAWVALVLWLGVGSVMSGYSPKELLEKFPNQTQSEWAGLSNSPIERVRSALMPLWPHSRIVVPVLLVVAIGFTVVWARRRSKHAP